MHRSLVWLCCLALVGCGSETASLDPPGSYSVVTQYPHDTSAYTQGLILRPGGVLLESTGLYGRSTLRRVTLATGTPTFTVPLPPTRFGEGLALHGGRLYQLTWQERIAYVYDEATLALVDSIRYTGEGWGLTTDGTNLIMSDGSDTLRVIDPVTFATRRTVAVRYGSGEPARRLNELEYVGGEVFANVFQTDWILRIDLATGAVRETLDFASLLPQFSSTFTSENVLNGIAYDPATGHLLVTGKRWPSLFEVRLGRAPGASAEAP